MSNCSKMEKANTRMRWIATVVQSLGQRTRCVVLLVVISLTLTSYYLAMSRINLATHPMPCPGIYGQKINNNTNSTRKFPASRGAQRDETGASQPMCAYYGCIIPAGRLGNQIFQYASAFGISHPHRRPIMVEDTDEVYQYFELPSAAVVRDRDRFCRQFPRISERKGCCTFDPEVVSNTKPNRSYTFWKHLQSWRYFAHVGKDLEKELTFRPFIKEPATEIVENYRQAYSLQSSARVTMVGVHIRGGDVNNTRHRRYGMTMAPVSYIHKAVDHFLEMFEHVLFIVTSNVIAEANRFMNYRNISVEYVYVSPSIDLAILSSCDHVIISVGSYGWWAGFLSRGVVVYYKYPMSEGSKVRREFNYNDYFMPHWIGLA